MFLPSIFINIKFKSIVSCTDEFKYTFYIHLAAPCLNSLIYLYPEDLTEGKDGGQGFLYYVKLNFLFYVEKNLSKTSHSLFSSFNLRHDVFILVNHQIDFWKKNQQYSHEKKRKKN